MNQIIAKKSQYIHWTASEVYLAVKKRDWHQQSTPAHESGCDVFFVFRFSGEEAGQSGQKSMPEPMISHLWSHILETLILRRLCLALSSSQ